LEVGSWEFGVEGLLLRQRRDRFVARTDETLVAVSPPVAEQDVWLVTHPEFRRDPRVRVAADFLKRVATGPQGLC